MAGYLAISGGADSTAMALLLHERGEDFEMVFADTGAELPETYWLIPRLQQYVGKPLTVVSNGTFYQHLSNYGFLLPSVLARWCTRVLKMVPQDRFFGAIGECDVGVGIRADEMRRANRPPRKTVTFRYPLVEAGMGKADVLALCEQHGLLSPAYRWRTNTSCFCCPFQRLADWRGLAKNHPDLYALAEDWEEHTKVRAEREGLPHYTWIRGKRLKDLREATERQLEFWPECPEEACTICTW